MTENACLSYGFLFQKYSQTCQWQPPCTHAHSCKHSTVPSCLRLNTAMAISVPQTDSSYWRSLILREALFTGWVPSTWGDFLPPGVGTMLDHPYICISRMVHQFFFFKQTINNKFMSLLIDWDSVSKSTRTKCPCPCYIGLPCKAVVEKCSWLKALN